MRHIRTWTTWRLAHNDRSSSVVSSLLGVSPSYDFWMAMFWNHLSVPSSKAGYEVWRWLERGPVFIPGPRCTGSSGTNGGVVGGGGSEWVSWCGGGSIREVVRSCQVIVCWGDLVLFVLRLSFNVMVKNRSILPMCSVENAKQWIKYANLLIIWVLYHTSLELRTVLVYWETVLPGRI
jgi:hypothetical protein